jgi:hypothetical protein
LRSRNQISLGIIISLVLFVFSQLVGCGGAGGDSPKEVVIKLFGAMERDDRPAIVNSLDMAALMNSTDQDYALQREQPRVFHNPEKLLDDLTGVGLTKTTWFNMKRVVGNTEIHGDTAYVEVSFISPKTGIQYYNKFGLHRMNGQWRIYSFRTMTGKE